MRSTSGGSCVAASTRMLRSVTQCDGVVTTLIAEAGERQWPPTTVAYRWCRPSPQWPPSWCVRGPHRRLGVRHQPEHSWLLGQPPDIRQEDHGLPLLGGTHSGGNVGPVGLLPTLGDPCHSHARRRGPCIHRGYGSAEGCQRRQVMEPHS